MGKYVEYEDSYKSLKEALLHGGLAHRLKVNINWIESETMPWPECAPDLDKFHGYRVSGALGEGGREGLVARDQWVVRGGGNTRAMNGALLEAVAAQLRWSPGMETTGTESLALANTMAGLAANRRYT